jgi:hypothetical protein
MCVCEPPGGTGKCIHKPLGDGRCIHVGGTHDWVTDVRPQTSGRHTLTGAGCASATSWRHLWSFRVGSRRRTTQQEYQTSHAVLCCLSSLEITYLPGIAIIPDPRNTSSLSKQGPLFSDQKLWHWHDEQDPSEALLDCFCCFTCRGKELVRSPGMEIAWS